MDTSVLAVYFRSLIKVFVLFVQICREFHRITKVHLMATFQSALEKFAPALLKLYRSKKESEFRALLAPLDEQVRKSIHVSDYF